MKVDVRIFSEHYYHMYTVEVCFTSPEGVTMMMSNTLYMLGLLTVYVKHYVTSRKLEIV